VACSEDAPLARIPAGLDAVIAAALPTVGVTAMQIAESLAPLDGKIVLIVGAAGATGRCRAHHPARAGRKPKIGRGLELLEIRKLAPQRRSPGSGDRRSP
jgi:hypothetical protein